MHKPSATPDAEALPPHPFSTAAISIQARPPVYMARMVTLAICSMAVIAVCYACLASVDIVVAAQGRVIPSGKSKVIQALESGVVRAIHVRDGQRVRAGMTLLALDQTSTDADRHRLQYEYWESQAEVARLSALLQGQATYAVMPDVPPEIAENQQAILFSRLAEQRSRMAALDADIARRRADYDAVASHLRQIRNSLPLVNKKHQMRQDLAQTGHIAETAVIESGLELIHLQKEDAVQQNRLKESEAGMHAAIEQKAQAMAEFRARISSERMAAAKKHNVARQELIKATQRRDLQILKAPIDGVVQQLAVVTVGGVVTPAQPLMSIVPENTPLEVEAQVNNRDIGHVKVGQRVIAKIETYDYTRYGYIDGAVQWVGTDAVMDPQLGPVYPVRITLKEIQTPNMVRGSKGTVTAGMNVTADIKINERRMIAYFLAPMLRYKEESLRER